MLLEAALSVPSNAAIPTDVNALSFANVIVVNSATSRKAFLPIEVTEAGISTLVIAVPVNASPPIVSNAELLSKVSVVRAHKRFVSPSVFKVFLTSRGISVFADHFFF